MNLKPDSGCKIRNTCCVRSIVMIKLDLVKDEDADEYSNAENLTAPDEDDNYGTKILK